MTTAKRWLLGAAGYGGLMTAVALAPLPGPAAALCFLGIWVALGFTVRSYAAIVFVLVVPIWDAVKGTSSGDMGPAWHFDLIIAVPIGALCVAVGVLIGRRRATPLRSPGVASPDGP